MEIVNVSASDYPQIRDILNYYILNTKVNFEIEAIGVEAFKAMVDDIKYPFLVAKEKDEVFGYAYLSKYNSKKGYNITSDLTIYLDHCKKSRGLGTLLFNELLSRAKDTEIENIISIIELSNKESIEFHKKMGFVKVSTMNNVGYKFGQYLSVSYYLKRIKDFKNINPQ